VSANRQFKHIKTSIHQIANKWNFTEAVGGAQYQEMGINI
jgi:hypothetical protein